MRVHTYMCVSLAFLLQYPSPALNLTLISCESHVTHSFWGGVVSNAPSANTEAAVVHRIRQVMVDNLALAACS